MKGQDNKKVFIDQHILLRYLFSPLANAISPLFALIGISQNLVTLIWLIILLITVILSFLGTSFTIILTLFILIFFLDCIDGSLARLTKKTSLKGKFFDDLGGDFFQVGFWICIGNAAYHQSIPCENSILSISLAYGAGIMKWSALVLTYRFNQTLPNTR